MRIHTALFASSLALAGSAVAGDYWSGAYVVGGGVGGVECRQYTAALAQAEPYGVGSPEYDAATYGFTMYLSGFRTAYNLQTPDTCDVFGRFTTQQLLGWLKYYCNSYPTRRFGSAVVTLAQGLHSGRVRSCQR
jgi:hypothetical protein